MGQGPRPSQRIELKTLACILAVAVFSHLSLSLEVEDTPPLNSEVWLEPVTSEIAQGRILGNSSALTVGALALAAGSGLAGLYNKYKDKIPSSSYASRPSYYSGPSYSSSYPSYSTGYPSYSSGNPSYSSGNPSYSSGYPSSPTTVYRPSHSRPSYTSRPAYRPAVVRPTTYHKPSPPSSFPAVVRPTTYHKPSPPTSVPAPVQQSSIQNPLY